MSSKEKRKKKFYLILILGLLSAVGPFSIDMYLPGFPNIAADLHTTVAHVSYSLSSFFIGISFGQLLYGPLLDRFGRKPPLYAGLILYLVASLACAIVVSANQLIILRLLQAIGACGGMVAARAMVRDLFPVDEIAKVFATLMLVIGVSPIIAPTVGGYVTATIGWHYVFVILTAMDAVILALVFFLLPESRHANPSISLKAKPILKGFLNVIREPQFFTYAFTGAIASAGLYAYIAGSPSVFMELFKVTEKQYGWIFAFNAVGLITSSQLNTLMLRTRKSEHLIRVALICQTAATVIFFIAAILGLLNIYSTIFFIFAFLCCQGFVFPNSSALSLAPFTQNAGSASALMGAIQMGIGTLTSAIVSFLSNNTTLPMTGVMACCAVCSLSILLVGRKIIRYRANDGDVEEETAEMMSTF
jgi:DHA1 family bicyclomycin/chloramphenicol resistance-like MFS transporter